MARILYLVHRIPYPPNKGDKIRSYNILAALAREHEIVLGAFVDDPADMQYASLLEELCDETFLRPISATWRKAASAHGFLTGEALSVAFYRDRAFRAWVKAKIGEGVDKIVIFSSAMARFVDFDRLGDIPVWMDFVDLDSDKWTQYAQAQNGVMQWVYTREASRLLAFEKDVASRVSMSSFVTDAEVTLFKEQAGMPGARVQAVHNGVDLAFFSRRDFAGDGNDIVFTGAMDYQANVDAVQWFADMVLPLIQDKRPEARFTIVGSKPTPAVQALAERRGVTVTGFVDDVRDYVADAAVCVAPMRIARGVQNKVLEAMAMARPVVSTTAGFEGIVAEPGRDLIVADEKPAFAEGVLSLMNDPQEADSLGRRARQAMEAGYDWDNALAALTDFARAGR